MLALVTLPQHGPLNPGIHGALLGFALCARAHAKLGTEECHLATWLLYVLSALLGWNLGGL